MRVAEPSLTPAGPRIDRRGQSQRACGCGQRRLPCRAPIGPACVGRNARAAPTALRHSPPGPIRPWQTARHGRPPSDAPTLHAARFTPCRSMRASAAPPAATDVATRPRARHEPAARSARVAPQDRHGQDLSREGGRHRARRPVRALLYIARQMRGLARFVAGASRAALQRLTI